MKTSNHKISKIQFNGDMMMLLIEDIFINIPLRLVSSKLEMASSSIRNDYRISPSGYGIHWPQLDEDLSINGLMKFAEK